MVPAYNRQFQHSLMVVPVEAGVFIKSSPYLNVEF